MKLCSNELWAFYVLVLFCVLPQYSSGKSSYEEQPLSPDDVRHHVNTKPRITAMSVVTDVSNRFAKTTITSSMRNTASQPQETVFTVVLPNTAYITGFVLETGNRTYEAYVKGREEAQQLYKEAVNKGQSTANVEASARDSNRFNVSVNIGAAQKVLFKLHYEQLLHRENGQYEVVINLHPGQPVDELAVRVNIDESLPLAFVRSPTLRSGTSLGNTKTINLAQIQRHNASSASVWFQPNVRQQKKLAFSLRTKVDRGFSGQFVVQYDVVRNVLGGEVLVHDGYFVHFFSPRNLPTLPKHVIFVLDVSGSMEGTKIEQLKDAMDTILQELNLQDVFNIVQFEHTVGVWDMENVKIDSGYNKAVRANRRNIANARDVIQKLKAEGGTNILDALKTGLDLVTSHKENTDSKHDPMIIFLTDGEPTVGETDVQTIINTVTQLNHFKVPIYTLSFGEGADKKFLKALSERNRAGLKPIYEATDAASQLKHFYRTISSPELSNVQFQYSNVTNVTKTDFAFYFGGSELVVAGEFDKNSSLLPSIKASGANGSVIYPAHVQILTEPLERHWAYLQIKQLLDASESVDQNEKQEFTKKALDLALKYKFVTPVSSLVVVKPNATELADLTDASPPTNFEENPNSGCGVNNVTTNYIQLERAVWDTTQIDTTYIFSTQNVSSVDTDSENYVEVDLNENNELEIAVKTIDEASEMSQNTNYVYNFVINLYCKDGSTAQVYMTVPFRDTNNHGPFFEQSYYNFNLVSPLLDEFLMQLSQHPIIATDIDVTNDRLIFSIGNNPYFTVKYNGTVADSLNKKHYAALVPKKKHMHITKPVIVELMVMDIGHPPKKSTSPLIINPPVLPKPEFTKPFYFGHYYGNQTIVMSDRPRLKHEDHIYYSIKTALIKDFQGDYYLYEAKLGDEYTIQYGHIGDVVFSNENIHQLNFELRATYTDPYTGISESGSTVIMIILHRDNSDKWNRVNIV